MWHFQGRDYALLREDYVGRAWLHRLARVSRIHAYRIHPPIVPLVSIVGRKTLQVTKGPSVTGEKPSPSDLLFSSVPAHCVTRIVYSVPLLDCVRS